MKRKLELAGYVIVAVFLVLFAVPFLNNIHNIYLRLLSSGVVKLTNSTGNSGATGFIAKGRSGNKYIITNGHVCKLAENGVLTAEYLGDRFQVVVTKQYDFNDLCALSSHRPLGLAVRIARNMIIGETAWAIGHPLLEPRAVSVGELGSPVFISIVTAMNPKPEECQGPTYQLIDTSETAYSIFGITSICVRHLEASNSSISISPGNSGSPIVDLYGQVIAVAFAANQQGTRSYHVPLSDLVNFLEEL